MIELDVRGRGCENDGWMVLTQVVSSGGICY